MIALSLLKLTRNITIFLKFYTVLIFVVTVQSNSWFPFSLLTIVFVITIAFIIIRLHLQKLLIFLPEQSCLQLFDFPLFDRLMLFLNLLSKFIEQRQNSYSISMGEIQ